MPSTSYSLASTEEIIADMRAGKMVVLVDEEDRENEGDLVLAADHVTPEAINFMAKHGRGFHREVGVTGTTDSQPPRVGGSTSPRT